MKWTDDQVLNACQDFVTILSEANGPGGLALYQSMIAAIDEEVAWHESSLDKLQTFKNLVS